MLNRIRRKKGGKIFLIIIGILMMLLAFGYSYWQHIQGNNLEFWIYVFPISRVPEYVCGMIFGILVKDIHFNKKTWMFSVGEFLALSVVVKLIFTEMPEYLFRSAAYILPNCMLISIFALEGGIFSRMFSWKGFEILGDISFECFLLHQLIFTYYVEANWGANAALSGLGRAFSQTYILGITVLLAYALHKRTGNKICKNRNLVNDI